MNLRLPFLYRWNWRRFALHKMIPLKWQIMSVSTNKLSRFFAENACFCLTKREYQYGCEVVGLCLGLWVWRKRITVKYGSFHMGWRWKYSYVLGDWVPRLSPELDMPVEISPVLITWGSGWTGTNWEAWQVRYWYRNPSNTRRGIRSTGNWSVGGTTDCDHRYYLHGTRKNTHWNPFFLWTTMKINKAVAVSVS